MNKLKKHLKNNLPIYAVLIACIAILCVAIFVTHEEEVPKVDTSRFEVVTLKEALAMFEDPSPKLLIIGLNTCTATINYVPYLQYAQIENGFKTYYLELDDITSDQIEDYNKLVEKLDFEYNFMGETDKFGKFIGSTPMTVIIKNKKQVFGYIGSMNTSSLASITKLHGVATKEE